MPETPHTPKHQVGERFVTLHGEQDDGPDGEPRQTAPGEIGRIDSIHFPLAKGQETVYSIVFAPSGVWVFLSDRELDDPTAYTPQPVAADTSAPDSSPPAKQESKVAVVLSRIQELGLDEGSLDETVLEYKAAEASSINNEGLEAQVLYLLESNNRNRP